MDEHMGTISGKAARNRAADPARGTGNEGSLVGKWLRHGTLLLRVQQRWGAQPIVQYIRTTVYWNFESLFYISGMARFIHPNLEGCPAGERASRSVRPDAAGDRSLAQRRSGRQGRGPGLQLCGARGAAARDHVEPFHDAAERGPDREPQAGCHGDQSLASCRC